MPLRSNTYLKQVAQAGLLFACLLGSSASVAGTYPILYHVVEKNETLVSLSKKFGIDVDYIAETNGIEDGVLKVGQTILVPDISKFKMTELTNSKNQSKDSTSSKQVGQETQKQNKQVAKSSQRAIEVTRALIESQSGFVYSRGATGARVMPASYSPTAKSSAAKVVKASVNTTATTSTNNSAPKASAAKTKQATVSTASAAKTGATKTNTSTTKTNTGSATTSSSQTSQTKKVNRKSLAKLNNEGNYDYVVRAGDTLSHIALDFGIALSTLQDWNNVDESFILKVGDVVVVPSEESLRKRAEVQSKINPKKKSKNLAPTTDNTNTPAKQANKANKATKNSRQVSNKSAQLSDEVVAEYRVVSGDTLSAIAVANNVKQSALVDINDLQNQDSIKVGQVLKIPSKDYVPRMVTVIESSGTY